MCAFYDGRGGQYMLEESVMPRRHTAAAADVACIWPAPGDDAVAKAVAGRLNSWAGAVGSARLISTSSVVRNHFHVPKALCSSAGPLKFTAAGANQCPLADDVDVSAADAVPGAPLDEAQLSAGVRSSDAAISPDDHGLLSWTGDPNQASGTQLLTSGTLYLARLPIFKAGTAAKLWWIAATAGATATAGQSFAGLYGPTGARLTSVGVDAQVTTGGNTAVSVTLGTPQKLQLDGTVVYGAVLFNAGTAPTLARTAALSAAVANLGLTGSGLRWMTAGTGLTSLPTSVTLSAGVAAPGVWMGLGA